MESAVRPVSFADCATTAEPAEQWETIVKKAGPVRGLSSVMPAFAEAFTDEEVRDVVAYLRTFCPRADAYPPATSISGACSSPESVPEEEPSSASLIARTARRGRRS